MLPFSPVCMDEIYLMFTYLFEQKSQIYMKVYIMKLKKKIFISTEPDLAQSLFIAYCIYIDLS